VGRLWGVWVFRILGLAFLGVSGLLSDAAAAGSSFAKAERSGSRRGARGAGETVLLDGAADQRDKRGVLGVGEINRRHGPAGSYVNERLDGRSIREAHHQRRHLSEAGPGCLDRKDVEVRCAFFLDYSCATRLYICNAQCCAEDRKNSLTYSSKYAWG
jgi:hypothetical protein